ncbi:alpha/beta hydrolase [Streptomyces sp. SP17BM10]|uniref:alpha/beta hydrolase n=1 Tax=Streptomyces sp. SP17BM10 TaxID=3002530 RepID=UPI002E769E34|nr:alpha/beta hydrolase [Streptomyces sp. SP17BM10]MEE1788905.1 alpha/beta hydrolase [Streptomyces sp. SP17BM10]
MSNLFELLLSFDPTGLHDAAKAWRGLANGAESAETRHRNQVNGPLREMRWEGNDAQYAFSTMGRTEQILEIVRVESAAAALVLDTVAERISQAQTNLKNAVHHAEEWGLTVGSDGTVSLPPLGKGETHDPDAVSSPERTALTTLRGDAQEWIDKALADAKEASDNGDHALSRLDADILTRPRVFGSTAETAADVKDVAKDLGLAEPSVPDNKDPQKSADWWKSLSPEQQSSYLALYPAKIGGLDGLPATVRDEANRLALEQELDGLQTGNARGSGMTADEYNTREHNLMKLKEQLDQHDSAAEDKQLFLLGFDAEAYHGDGKVIIAMGNPDIADHTALLVPGTGTTIDSTGGNLARVNDMQDAARSASKGTNQKVSVVYWLGYDAPEIPVMQAPNLAVGGTTRAEDGAEALRQFTQGTRVAQGDHHSHLSVFSHSYGTTLVGAAAAGGNGLGADDIVAIASPGMTIQRADQLHIDPSHFWTGRAADDPIELAAGLTLGDDPMIDRFGGNNFEVDTSGHSGYWDGGKSLDNQGRIIVGRPPSIVPKLHDSPLPPP